MHIGFITPEYPHPKLKSGGGLGTSIKNLAEALVEKGVKVSVLAYQQEADFFFEDNGIQFYAFKRKQYPFLGWWRYRKYLQKAINRIVSAEKINLLEAPDWTGITAFMKFKVPLLIRFHGSDAYFCKLEGRKQKVKNFFFEKTALLGAKAYIAPTQFAGKVTQKVFGLNPNKIKVIHYGLKTEDFVNTALESFEPKTLLNVGTLIRKKGVFELVEIFNKLVEKEPEATLKLIGADAKDVITGEPSTFELMKKGFSEQAAKRVFYLGKLPYPEIKNHIQSAHVCVFPSFAETLGMVTIEAMAMQKAVINTNIGWGQELIDDGANGFLAHPSNHEDYVSTLLALFQDEKLCLQIGKNALKRVKERFDISTIVEENIHFYKSL